MRIESRLIPAFVLAVVTLGSAPVTVSLNEKPLAAPAIVRGGRVLLPFRAIFAGLKADVTYDSAQHAVRAQRGADRVFIKIGTHNSVIVADRLFVPVRYISESLGGSVRYEAADRIVFISDPRAEKTASQLSRAPASDAPIVTSATFSPQPIAYATPDANAPYYPQALNFYIPSEQRTYYPGDPMQFMLNAPPGGTAYLQLCNYGQIPFINPMGSTQYILSLTVPRRLAGHSCTATAYFVGPLGARQTLSLPFALAFPEPPAVATAKPTPTPRPPAATPTPAAREIEPPSMRKPQKRATPKPKPPVVGKPAP
jgi:hypothetical protein